MKRIVAVIAALVVVAGTSWFIGSRSGSDAPESDGSQTIIRRNVDRATLSDVVTLQGELLRDELQVVNSPVDGRIASVEVTDGDTVEPGDSLFVLDGRAAVAVNGGFSFFRPLDVGSDGPDVLQLETILSDSGYPVGPVDRLFTEATRSGLAAWQVDHGYGGATPEPVETVTVVLQQNQAGYTIGAQNTAAVTIGPSVPDAAGGRQPRHAPLGVPDPIRRVEVTAGVDEVDEGATATFTFTVDTPFASDTNVAITTSGDATEDDDYDSLPSRVVFPAGASSVDLVVTTLEDDVLESTAEELTVGISTNLPPEPLYTIGGRSDATVLIRADGGDEQTTLTIRAGAPSVGEGSSAPIGGFGGASAMSFTIDSALELNEDLEIRYRLAGSAGEGTDYDDPDDEHDGPVGVIVLPAGDTSVDLSIDLRDDDRVEYDETIVVTLEANPDLTEFDPNYRIGSPSQASSIVTSDDVPELTLRGGGAIGEGGATSLVIRADQAPVEDTSVNFSVNGSAQPGDDFEALTGTVLLRAGQTQVSIPISSLDDDVVFEPSDMIVASWPARIGTVEVDAGEFVPQGTPLMSLTEPIFTVRLYAAATQFSELTIGQEVTVELDAGNQEADGIISALDDSASVDDAGNERYEGVVQVSGEFAAVDGAVVSIDVILDQAVDALAVPIAAVSQDASGNKEVRVIADDGTITRVPVETGLEDGALIEITSGLEGDEIVVVEVDPPS